jgi:hypothetical protein
MGMARRGLNPNLNLDLNLTLKAAFSIPIIRIRWDMAVAKLERERKSAVAVLRRLIVVVGACLAAASKIGCFERPFPSLSNSEAYFPWLLAAPFYYIH